MKETLFCPNFKNSAVRQEFNEISDVVGEVIAYDIWNKNGGYGIDKAPNGEPSVLFSDILSSKENNRVDAIKEKVKQLSNSSLNANKERDINGEPVFPSSNIANFNNIKKNVTSVSRSIHYLKGLGFNKRNQMVLDVYFKLIDNKILKDLPIYYVDNVEQDSAGVYYYNDRIEISNKLADMDIVRTQYTLMHEISHHFTSGLYDTDASFKKAVDNAYAKYKRYNKDYAATQPKEFLAEILTNGSVRSNLANAVYADNTTVFQRIKNALIRAVEKLLNSIGYTSQYINDKAKTVSQMKKESRETALEFVEYIIDAISNITYLPDVIENNSNNPYMTSFENVIEKIKNPNKRDEGMIKSAATKANNVREGIKNRIRAIKTRQHDPFYVKELERLRVALDAMEDKEALISFVRHVKMDMRNPVTHINKAYAGKIPISDKMLMQFKQDYIGFYESMINDIRESYDQGYFNDMEETELDSFKKEIQLIQEAFNVMQNKYNMLVRESFEKNLKKMGESAGSPTMESYIQNSTEEIATDINWWERNLGSMSGVNDEALRAVYKEVSDVKNGIERKVLRKGKQLAELQRGVGNTLSLFELDANGKKTGYIVRSLNFGEFRRNEKAFRESFDNPSTPEELREYRIARNKWLTANAERRYIPEYYDLFANLSAEATMARDEIQEQIDIIINSVKDKNGNVDLSRLSDNQWEQLELMYRRKRHLANQYTEHGIKKTGIDLDIANELTLLNNAIYDKLNYKTNVDKFNSELERASKELTPDRYNKWVERNTMREYTKEFWDEMDKLGERYYNEEYANLEAERKELHKLYRNLDNIEINEELIPDRVKDVLKWIDRRMNQIRSEVKPTYLEEGTVRFNHIAEIKTTKAYNIAQKNAAKRDSKEPGYYKEWVRDNHYINPVTGKATPYSWWTYLEPKDKAKIKIVPSRAWSEVDPTSPWYNSNFDETMDEHIQPKRSLYDNSKSYEKVKSNPKLKALYDELVNTMAESNDKLSFRRYNDNYKLPQITGTLYQFLKSKDKKIAGLLSYVKDSVVVNSDDMDFIETTVKRPDGSDLYFVPTHFLKELEDTNTLTNDIVGAVIQYYRMAENFKEMNAVAPRIAIIKEQIGKRVYHRRRGSMVRGGDVSGKETNAYKKLEDFERMNVFGERKRNLTMTVFGTEINLAKILTNIRNYAQTVNLGLNITAMEAGFFTGMHQALLEALTGRLYTKGDFALAFKQTMDGMFKTMLGFGSIYTKNYKVRGKGISSDNLSLALLELNQVSRSNQEIFHKMNQWRWGRFLTNHFWYGGFAGGDFIVKSMISNAVYNNYKLVTNPTTGNEEFISKTHFIERFYPTNRKDGEQAWKVQKGISLRDAYFVKEGVALVKDDFSKYVPETLQNEVANTITRIAADADGVLTDLDKTNLHANAWGQHFAMHRGFILRNVENRFLKKKGWNYQTQMMDEAVYTAASRVVLEKFKGLARVLKTLNVDNLKVEMTDAERYAIKKVLTELKMLIAYVMLTSIIAGIADDDDDDWFKEHIALMATRTLLEVRSQYVLTDVINLVKSPSATMNTFGQYEFLLGGILNPVAVYNWQDNLGKETKRGPYKGLPAYQKAIIKSTPFKHIIEATDPKLKRNYLENQIMN